MTTEKLKPCPFCNEITLVDSYIRERNAMFYVECICGVSTNDHDTNAEAIVQWNTRAPTPAEKALAELVRIKCAKDALKAEQATGNVTYERAMIICKGMEELQDQAETAWEEARKVLNDD